MTVDVHLADKTTGRASMDVKVVDCDVHPTPARGELLEYMPEPTRSRFGRRHGSEVEIGTALGLYLPPRAHRLDAMPPSGLAPAEDPAFTARQLFQEAGVDYAMLFSLDPKPKNVDPRVDSDFCAACNAWLADTWLTKYNHHGRFRGAIWVNPRDPERAVSEIERWAGHPFMSQVQIFPEILSAFGYPEFDPVWEAAARHGLPVAMHIIRQGGMHAFTPVGFPSYHMEIMAEWPLYFFSHLASFVFCGTFDRIPSLRLVCVEGGFGWVPSLLWRLDNGWRALGGGGSAVKRAPSEYIREHVRFTTQPVEEPAARKSLLRAMEWMDAGQLLMFSTDYPHYDFDHPDWVVRRLPERYRDRVMNGNAIELYGLPATRLADEFDEAE